MATTWPEAYCWLYAPFLLETTTSGELEKFSEVNGSFKPFVDIRRPNNWMEDDHGISKTFVGLYKMCAEGTLFSSWIKYTLRKSNPPPPIRTFEPTLTLLTQKMKRELFERFFDKPRSLDLVSRITAVLDVQHVVEKIDAEGHFPELVKSMKPHLAKKQSTFNNWAARCHFLLLLFGSDNPPNLCWYMEFLRVLTTKATTRPVARFIDGDYEEAISYYEATLKEAHLEKVRKIANFANPNEPSSPRPQQNFGEVVSSEKHVENIINLYDYQHELSNKAVSDENTIICAPTGSGKTVVAAYIIRDHLRRTIASGNVGRAVVFVPTIILVEQQAMVLRKLLGSEFAVTTLCGAEPKYATDKVLEVMVGDIVVTTPQVFLNLHMSPFKERKIYIRDFTFMIFDECHHCDKKHPYRIIMKAVMKNWVIKSEQKTIPQVVGLTASVGTGDARSADSAEVITHITALCARMGAVSISSVQHASNIEDMKARVPKPVDDYITVNPPARDQFAIELSNIASDIEINLEPTLKEVVQNSNHLTNEKVLIQQRVSCYNGSQRTSIKYTSKLASTKEYVKQSSLPKEKKAYAYWLLEYLWKIHYTLKYNELLPSQDAMRYASDAYESVVDDIRANIHQSWDPTILEDIKNVTRSIGDSLRALNQSPIIDPPDKNILNSLLNQIKKQYDVNPNSRILIFIDMRRGCYDLARYLNRHRDITRIFGRDKVSYLMSTQSGGKGDTFVPTRAEQSRIRSDFDKGKINILVTTSVSDEGVDVAACNLVIKYNSVGNEKTYIQRRGRARAAGGRAVLIALGVDTERREYNNVFRECIMNRCLHTLATMNAGEIRAQIERRKNEQSILESQISNLHLTDRNYSIHCGKCQTIIGETKQLRLLPDDTVVLCNPGILDKADIGKLTDRRFDEKLCSIRCAAAKCAGCKHTWGPMVKYADLYFVSPRLDGIRINGIEIKEARESWQRLMRDNIYVGDIQRTDLVVMFNDHLGEKETELEIAIGQQVRNIIAQNKRHQAISGRD